MIRDTRWLSVHVYDERPWERVLIELVAPLIELLGSAGLAERYFFVRYWDQGPHVRVRLEAGAADAFEVVRPALDAYLAELAPASEPGSTTETAGTVESSRGPTTHRPRAVYERYVPEVERYGGRIGVEIAERQFCVSSAAVLKWAMERHTWTYETALGAALQFHVSFASSLGMSAEDTQRFYGRVADDWLPWSAGGSHSTRSHFAAGWRDALLERFREGFEQSASSVVTHCSRIWSSLSSEASPADAWLTHWVDGMRLVAPQLSLAAEQGQLAMQHRPGTRRSASRPDHLWPILASYVHMTNNRLGILNRDEAYLAYLISRGMSRVR